jgi:two-component system, response regulator PdtaR
MGSIGANGAMNKIRVLLIEDQIDIATLLAEVLSGIGCSVCGIEATEAGAVAATQRVKPDIMIVDAQLREGSGCGRADIGLRIHPACVCERKRNCRWRTQS